MRTHLCRLSALVSAIMLSGAALAQIDGGGSGGQAILPGTSESSDQPAGQPATDTIQTSLGSYGDPGGYRAFLAGRGITYSLTYIGETLGVASGGLRRGAIYEGRLDAQLDVDLEKLAGLSGLAFHTNAYQIHGHGLSRYYLGNIFVTSGIEALSSTRLYELWLEQKFLEDRLAIRAGQLAADTEFLVSQYAGLFVNSTFGWPGITAVNLPSGGPAYPLATPGIRVKVAPMPGVSAMLGIFNGDPAGPGPGDPQRNDRGGVEFRARDPALIIGEAAYSYGAKDTLSGTVKFGGWTHLGRFDSPRFDAFGGSLADPAGSGIARRFRGNYGLYGVVDQLLYRVPGTEDGGLGVFARVSGSPGDRNLVDVYVDGGFTYKGLIPGRPDDTFGVSASYARISDAYRGFDRDSVLFNGTPSPIRSSEAMVEVTYQAQIVPGWTVQPDFQYIFRPGGGVVNSRSPVMALEKDAAVVGLRTTIRY